jgi:preprotein translocase subunit SecD
MPRLLLPLLAAATLLCTGGAKKPSVDLRIHTEGLAAEAPTFAFPAKLMNGNETYLARMPLLTQREIKAIYPFAAADGSQGVYLKLDSHGSGLLQQYSMERSGRPLVVFLNSRQISNLVVDRPINDGIVCLPRGLTEDDINLLSSFFPVLGQEGAKKKGR